MRLFGDLTVITETKKEFNVIAAGATNCKKGYCIENECSEFVCIEYITD